MTELVEELTAAHPPGPGDPSLMQDLGIACAALAEFHGDRPGALAELERYAEQSVGYLLAVDQDWADRLAATQAIGVAEAHANEGRVHGGVELLQSVLPRLERGDMQRPEVLLRLGTAAFSAGDPVAWEHLRAAEAEPRVHPRIAPQIPLQRARWHIQGGLPDHAHRALRDARPRVEALLERGETVPYIRSAHAYVEADLLLAQSLWEAVVPFSERALADPELFQEAGATFRERTRLVLATALARRDEAADDLPRARRLFEQVDRSPDTIPAARLRARLGMAEIELDGGRFDRAAAWLERARETLDEIGEGMNPEALVRDHGQLAVLECRAALEGSRREDLEQATLELARRFDALLERWHAVPSPASGRGLLQYRSPLEMLDTLCRAETALDPVEGPLRALEHVFEAHRANTLLRATQQDGGTLSAFRDAFLSEARGALLFLPGVRRSSLFAFDRDALVVESGLPGQRELAELALEFQVALDAGAVQRLDGNGARLGRRLAEHLMPASVATLLERWSEVVFLGEEHLHGLRIEALPFRGRPLGVELAVSGLYAMPLGNALVDRSTGDTSGLCLVASPVHAPGREELPLALDADELGRLTVGLEEPTVLSDARATAASLGVLHERRYSVLAFLTHGVYEAARELPAGLLLSPESDGTDVLHAEDVEGLAVPPLVFVGACGAGRGARRPGDPGASHLGGAFLASGARAVVYADDNVPFESTLELTRRFLGFAFAGLPPAEALRRARLELFEAGTRDPAELCLLRVVGAAHLPIPAERTLDRQSSRTTGRIVVLGLAALLGVFLAARRRG